MQGNIGIYKSWDQKIHRMQGASKHAKDRSDESSFVDVRQCLNREPNLWLLRTASIACETHAWQDVSSIYLWSKMYSKIDCQVQATGQQKTEVMKAAFKMN